MALKLFSEHTSLEQNAPLKFHSQAQKDGAEMEALTLKTIERAGDSLNKGFVRVKVKPMSATSDRQSPQRVPECVSLLDSPLSRISHS